MINDCITSCEAIPKFGMVGLWDSNPKPFLISKKRSQRASVRLYIASHDIRLAYSNF
jgi:hypothetical protein